MNKKMLEDYATKVVEDDVFRGKLEQSKSPEEALEVVKAAGFDFSMDDFQKLMQNVVVAVKKRTGAELSDSELAMVANDWSDADTVATVLASASLAVTTVSTVASIVAAAAAAA